MSNLTFDEKLKKIIGMSHSDYLNGSENTDDCIDQIKQLISEVLGEDEIWETPLDFSGHEEKVKIVGRNDLKKEFRHAFNLNNMPLQGE